MGLLKQSTARARTFLMVASSDHLTGIAAASPVVTLSKAGAHSPRLVALSPTSATAGTRSRSPPPTPTRSEISPSTSPAPVRTRPIGPTKSRLASLTTLNSRHRADITGNQNVNVAQWNGTNVAANLQLPAFRKSRSKMATFTQAAAYKVWSTAARDAQCVQTKFSTSPLARTTISRLRSLGRCNSGDMGCAHLGAHHCRLDRQTNRRQSRYSRELALDLRRCGYVGHHDAARSTHRRSRDEPR
jgi:hypothetical protein